MLKASAYRPLVQCQPSITEVSEQLSQFSVIDGRLWRAAEFGQFLPRKTVGPTDDGGLHFFDPITRSMPSLDVFASMRTNQQIQVSQVVLRC